MNKNLLKRIIGGLIGIIFGIGLFLGGFVFAKNVYMPDEIGSIKFIVDTYKEYYYQEQDNLPSIFANSLMDEYSKYYTKEEYELSQKASRGYRKSIGISVSDNLTITKVLFNSPAYKSGVCEGGKITHVNGVSVKNRSEFDIFVDEQVELTVEYVNGVKNHTISVEEFVETFVKYYDCQSEYWFEFEDKMELKQKQTSLSGLDDKTGYLVYRGFSAINSDKPSEWIGDTCTSCGQFAKALQIYSQSGKSKLIIDLRNNGGGFISVLTSVVSHFLDDENAIIGEAKYKGGKVENFYALSPLRQQYNFEKITILVNKNTASASEAFVGALLDYDNEGVVEVICEYNDRRKDYSSYGKGIMQSTIVNRATSEALKLTVAEIFWPISKQSIHQKGISPSIGEKVKASVINGQPVDALQFCLRG